MTHPFLDHDGPIALAHRGGAVEEGLENTLPAFQDAVDLGYRYLETDVHATADGVLVAFHDETLDRATDRRGSIATMAWAEVARARVGGREPIPRFDELLASFPGVCWNIDLKADAAVLPLLTRLAADPGLLERCCVVSFSDARIAAARTALGARVCTAAGPDEVRRLRVRSLAAPLSSRRAPAADCVQVPTHHGRVPLADRTLLAAAHRQGLPVHVWTINDESEMHRLLDRGVDGIVTDATRTLRRVLQQRGDWPGQRGEQPSPRSSM